MYGFFCSFKCHLNRTAHYNSDLFFFFFFLFYYCCCWLHWAENKLKYFKQSTKYLFVNEPQQITSTGNEFPALFLPQFCCCWSGAVTPQTLKGNQRHNPRPEFYERKKTDRRTAGLIWMLIATIELSSQLKSKEEEKTLVLFVIFSPIIFIKSNKLFTIFKICRFTSVSELSYFV